MKKYLAEMVGTMVLVLMGCGSAVFAGKCGEGAVSTGVGTLGVALAFGLAVVAMAYAIGGISGCHINPAITLGVFLSGRMNGKRSRHVYGISGYRSHHRFGRSLRIGLYRRSRRAYGHRFQRVCRWNDVVGFHCRGSVHVYFRTGCF